MNAVRLVVVKVGTNSLTGRDGRFSTRRVSMLARQVATLRGRGLDVVVVSSGAIGAGLRRLELDTRPDSLPGLQAAAAVGQPQLMKAWDAALARHGIPSAQVLLTRDDCSHRRRYLNARNTLAHLIDSGVVPIVNENDTISTDEIALGTSFGENDVLAALVTNLVRGDLLAILTDVAGLHARTEAGLSKAPIDTVEAITPEIRRHAGGSTSGVGKGGMVSKLKAAELVMKSGEACAVVGGSGRDVLVKLLAGEPVGTLFLPGPRKLSSRKRWIGFDGKAAGSVTIDSGAVAALVKRGKSLLPGGVVSVHGRFGRGDILTVQDESGRTVARGQTNYTSAELETIKGAKSSAISSLLGAKPYDEAIHRDNLVLV